MKKIGIIMINLLLLTTVFAGCLQESGSEKKDDEYTAPLVSIISPSYRERVSDVVEIRIFVSPMREGQIISYYVDETLLERSSSLHCLWDTTTVENGIHLIEITVEDTAPELEGMPPSTAAVVVNVYNAPSSEPESNTPPVVKINPPNGAINGVYHGSVLLTGKAWDAQTTIHSIQMRIDGGEWFEVEVRNKEWRKIMHWESFSGTVKIEVRAYDGAEYSEIKTITLNYDSLPPEITFIHPTEGEVMCGIENLSVRVNDENGLSFISFSIDGNELQNSSTTVMEINTTLFTNGEHRLLVGASDILDNYAEKEIFFMVNNSIPSENHYPNVNITFPENGSVVEKTITVSGTAEDPDGDIKSLAYRVDGGEWIKIEAYNNNEWSFRLDMEDYGGGEHTIEVMVLDQEENTAIDSIIVIVKNCPPIITIHSPAQGSAHRGELIVEGNVSDPDGDISELSLSYSMDDGEWNDITPEENWTFNISTVSIPDGNHTLTVRAVDDRNDEARDSVIIFTDNTPPVIKKILTEPSGIFWRDTVEVRVNISDLSPLNYINFDFNGRSIQNSTSNNVSIPTESYEDGEYFVVINASDILGNVLKEFGINNTLPVVVDNTPPTLDILSPSNGDFVHGSVEIIASVSDRNGIRYVSFKIDDNEMQNSTSRRFQWNTTLFSEGTHNITVLAADNAGNTNTTSITLKVDNTPPEVSISSPSESETVDDVFYINVSAHDPGINASGMANLLFYIGLHYLGMDDEIPYEMPVNTSTLSDGDYTIRVIGKDLAGNSREALVNITVRNTSGAIIDNPHTNYLMPYPVTGIKHIIIHDYNGIPYLSPLVKQDVAPSVNWNSNDPAHELNITYSSVGRFSGNLALSYYTQPDYSVVVDSYRHALLMAPIAWLLNAPLLLYDSRYTDEALWKLDTIYPEQIVVMGDTPYNDKGVMVVSEDELLEFALSTANMMGINLHYIALTNPNDEPENADVPHLSAFAAAFSIYHDGIVLPVSANSNQINSRAHDAFHAFTDFGMNDYFLALIGDARSVPFYSANVGGHYAPSDNIYADLDGDLTTVEIPIGRIISKSLPDLSYYLDRIIHYTEYHSVGRAYPPTTPAMGPFWENNALIYMGWATEHLAWQTSYRHWQVFITSLFSTQDDTPQAHGGGGGTTLLMEDFARANFIAMNADHGEPDRTMTFSSSDLLDMNPGVLFAVSCSLGRIDGVNIQTSMTYTVLQKGMNVYLGSTRTTYGAIGVTPEAADGLSLYFWQNLVNDESTGEAMMHAKKDLQQYGAMPINDYVCWEYVHYGDPAFNPYEPVNEGQ